MIFPKVHLWKLSYDFLFLYKFRIPIFEQFNIYKHVTSLNICRIEGQRIQITETYSMLYNDKTLKESNFFPFYFSTKLQLD